MKNNNKLKKSSDFKMSLNRLFKYMGNYYKGMIIIIILVILGTIISIVGPKILGKATTELANNVNVRNIYDEIIKNNDITNYSTIGDLEKENKLDEKIISRLNDDIRNISLKERPKINYDYIYKIFIIVAIIYVISTVFNYISNKYMGIISAKVMYKLRKDLDEKLSRLPLKYYDDNTRGEIISKMTTDVNNIQDTLQQGLIQLIQSIVTIVGIVAMMVSINLTMTFLILIAMPISLLIMKRVIKSSQIYFKKSQETIGSLNGHVEEIYSGNIVVKAFNNQEDEKNKFGEINGKLSKVEFKSQFISGFMMPSVAFVNHLAYIGLSVLGINLVIKGRLTIGNVQAFLQYTNRIMQPFSQIANTFTIVQSMVASSDRVFDFLEEEEVKDDPKNPVKLNKINGKVEFKNVVFSYNCNQKIINDISFSVDKSQTIAIVGPTGSGKTTLINLLMKFYDIDSGDILIDDVSIKDLTYYDVREIFAMVLQDTWLFNGTIMENLKYSGRNIKDKDVINAAKIVGVDHFIRALPGGYDFVINEEANNISDGQKQLLTIVRAMLANSPILILDEATSNVDTRTEEVIQKAMDKLMEGRTSFVIAHRLSTIKNADKIIVMKNGKIIESGNHNELLNKNGFYAELYNSQFEND